MHTTSPVGSAPASLPGVRGLWNGLAQRLEQLTPHGLIALAARLALAGISGCRAAQGGGRFTITDTTYLLFREDTGCR
jgi:putative oxidoreductase